MERIAQIISVLFHPLLIPTYAFLILFSQKAYYSLLIPYESKLRLVVLVFIITFVFPSLIVVFFISRKWISSFQMEDKNERIYPYIVTGIFFSLAYYLLKDIQISPIYHFFALGSAILVFVAFLINFLWKISIHMIAMGGITGMILGMSLMNLFNSSLILYGLIFCSGLVGFARLQLRAHSHAQVYAGYLLGLSGMLLLALFF